MENPEHDSEESRHQKWRQTRRATRTERRLRTYRNNAHPTGAWLAGLAMLTLVGALTYREFWWLMLVALGLAMAATSRLMLVASRRHRISSSGTRRPAKTRYPEDTDHKLPKAQPNPTTVDAAEGTKRW